MAFIPKSHNKTLPVSNPTLAARWDKMEHRRHRNAIKTMRSITDYSSPPKSVMGDDRVAALRRQARASEIEAGNSRLLDNITTIMRRPPGSAHGAREWNAHHNVAMRFVSTNIPALDPSEPNGYSPAGTLNAYTRRKQLMAIDAENRSLLRRMQLLRPTYDSNRYERDFYEREQRLQSLRSGSGPALPVHIASTQAAWPVEGSGAC